MAGSRRRWEVSEGLLSSTAAVNLGTEWSRRGNEGRGEWESADKDGGGGFGRFTRKRREYGDVTWREARGGRQFTWGRELWRE